MVHGKMRNTYRMLVGKPERKRQLGRPTCRWDDIKIHIKQGMFGEWINLALERILWQALVKTVINLRILYRQEICYRLRNY
jgi:hypothetical protein